jgi:tetratricopeptide (TPR) repeat protein
MAASSTKLGIGTALAAAFLLSMGHAAFSAGSDSSEPPAKTETTTKCTDGMVWDKNKKKCVKPDQSGFNDDEFYKAARELAYAGQYDNAIRILKLARNQNDPRILNYLGFANRKAGRMDLGMAYYRKALAIDADYLLARSYMGQALLDQGDVEGARMQLVEIRDRGGQGTWAYRALADSLKTGNTY